MSDAAFTIPAALIGYLSGSLPFAWAAARTMGVDILTVGTRNPGAANVFRVVDRRLGALVFLCDLAKGAAPVIIALILAVPDELAPVVGAAAVLGHWRPVYPKLGGGAGLATATGAALALAPLPGIIGLAIGLTALAAIRSSGHAAAIGVLAIAVAGYAFRQEWAGTSGALGMAGMVFLKNIAVGLRDRETVRSRFP